MDNRSSLRMMLEEFRPWWREKRLYRGLRSKFLCWYDRVIRRLPWVKFPKRGRPVRMWVRGVRRPFLVRLGSSDTKVLAGIFDEKEYHPVFEHDLGDVRQIVDLGANVGYSLRLWREQFPSARLIAVEPDQENLDLCRRNLALGDRPSTPSSAAPQNNHPTDMFFQACVAAKPGEVYLDRSVEQWSYKMQTDQKKAKEKSVAVKAMTMPQILEQAGAEEIVDLLKCDIEGAEREIFGDCESWVHRVRHMIVEVHYQIYTLDEFLSDLERAGWHVAGHEILHDVKHTTVHVWRAE